MKSEIKDFVENQTIFLTGGTGFLGKVLIEKILRECPEVNKIYLLVRPKKGKTPKQRLDELFDYPCFGVIKSKNLNISEKVHLIIGDCQKSFMGLKVEDAQLLKKEVTCVIHAAASVKFDQTLREATNNVRTTKDILELAKQMPSIQCFVYVSTAYSNCLNFHIKEKFYDPPITAEKLFNVVEALDDNVLQKITPYLLGNWPNTYVYTKCVSESLVRNVVNIPTAVVRPAIVIGSHREPLPGWIDNLYGPIGIATGVGLGVIRSMAAKRDAIAEMIPVDYVSNSTLSIMWKTGIEKPKTPLIYNLVGYKTNKMTWGSFVNKVGANYWDAATTKAIWYVSFKLRENLIWHKICVFFMHTMVAYFVDFVLFCLRKPTQAVKNYERLDKVLDMIAWFSLKSWDFESDNTLRLWSEMNDEDKKLFNFNMKEINWDFYMRDVVFGIRRYLVKETPDTIPEGKKKIRILFVAHYSFLAVFWYLVYKFVLCLLGLFFKSV